MIFHNTIMITQCVLNTSSYNFLSVFSHIICTTARTRELLHNKRLIDNRSSILLQKNFILQTSCKILNTTGWSFLAFFSIVWKGEVNYNRFLLFCCKIGLTFIFMFPSKRLSTLYSHEYITTTLPAQTSKNVHSKNSF